MKNKNELIKQVTNDLLRDKFATDIGQKAVVERHSLGTDEITEQLGEVLEEVGRNYSETGKAPKGMEYWGSIAVHIYAAPTLGQFANIKQIRSGKCPAPLLLAAVDDLRNGVIGPWGNEHNERGVVSND